MKWILPAHTSSLYNGFNLMEPAYSRKVTECPTTPMSKGFTVPVEAGEVAVCLTVSFFHFLSYQDTKGFTVAFGEG